MNDKNREVYVITGKNRLTGEREEICRPMSEVDAKSRLERELMSRRKQKFAYHTHLRVEKRLPTQLSIIFSAE